MLSDPQLMLYFSVLISFLLGVTITFALQQRRVIATRRALAATRDDLHAQQLDAREQGVALQVAEGEVETQREAVNAKTRELARFREAYYALKQTHGELTTRLEEKEANFSRQLQ
ncbi:MAG: hypothetical protein ABR580_07455, partial [Halomonas sp.]